MLDVVAEVDHTYEFPTGAVEGIKNPAVLTMVPVFNAAVASAVVVPDNSLN